MSSPPQDHNLRSEISMIGHCCVEVWKFIPPQQKVALLIAALLMAVTSAANTGVALLLGTLVDRIKVGIEEKWKPETIYPVAGWVLGMLAIVYVVREVFNVARRYLVETSSAQVNKNMQVRVVAHLMKTDLSSLTQEKVGTLHGKIFRSVEGVVRFLRGIFLDFMPAILTGLFALIAAITKQPMLGLVMIGVVPLAVFLTVRQLMTQKEVRMSLLRDCEEIDGAMVEQLSGMEYIRAAHTHQHEINRLKQLTEKRRVREVSHNWQMSLFGSAKALNEGFFHIVVLALATYLAINNKISFGDILTFSVLFLNVMSPLSEVHRVLDEGHEASLRVRDMIEMLEEPVDRSFQTKSAQSPRMHQGEAAITIRNLSICYLTPTGKPRLALDNISMQIRHGETIGVAGRSGSGKSTWIKVLLRLIHPSGGEVTIGGVPIDSVGRDEIGTLIGYVGQNPFVFSGTIAENIAYSNPNVTRAMIQRAAELAALHDEIMEMPHGYDTVITERGQNLSGGQRQRMAIARVLLKQAPILILDEATSALDNISERHVQRSLGITTDDRTTILIAHRLSTLRDCDRIIVFDEGTIAEVGTYTELVQRGGIFAELVMSAESSLCDEVKSPEIHLEPANEQRKQLCAAAAEQAVAS